MAFTLTPFTPLFPSQAYTRVNKLPLFSLANRANYNPAISCFSARKPYSPATATEQDILEAVAEYDDTKSVPGVRTYENDLARLTVVGPVDFQQALTAAAADGGEAAEEHIDAGMPAMVVETLFPGPSDEHSTISTRLFLPARKVREKARKLKSYLTKDILSSTTSTNILAMTFRQVILQHLWNFELVLLTPGTERNMDDLETPREVPASFAISASDQQVISVLAEVICLSALESTERHFFPESFGGTSKKFLPWFQKHKRIVSKNSSVTLYNLLESEIVSNANILLTKFSSERTCYKPREGRRKSNWLTSSTYSKLDQIGGPEFIAWLSEYAPAYRLQIDSEKLGDVKFEGWKETAPNTWEVLLTHSQMVGLSDILDMYYEDVYTLPNKVLSSGVVAKSFSRSPSKTRISLSRGMSMVLASGIFLVAVRVLGRKNYPQEIRAVHSYDTTIQHQSVESTELEDYCVSIVRRIKEFFGWPGEIVTESGSCAWVGELPTYLRRCEKDLQDLDLNSSSTPSERIDEEIKAAAQDIASYQVVLSMNGKIIGFQPTSRTAVNQWAANPLVKELYGGKNLSPGLIERGLKISQPSDVIVLELLVSLNPQSCFALVRPDNTAAENS